MQCTKFKLCFLSLSWYQYNIKYLFDLENRNEVLNAGTPYEKVRKG